jgi:hypothetical protein
MASAAQASAKQKARLSAHGERDGEEAERLDEDPHGVDDRRGLTPRRAGDEPRHHRQNDQTEYVVDDGCTQDDPRLGRIGAAEIFEDARRDPHARRREGRADEDVTVNPFVRKEPGCCGPAESERCHHAEHGHQERRPPDLEHLFDGGLEADLEEEHENPDARSKVDPDVRPERFEKTDTEEIDVPECDARHELAQHCRLAEPHGDLATEFGRNQNDGETENDGSRGIAVSAGFTRLCELG